MGPRRSSRASERRLADMNAHLVENEAAYFPSERDAYEQFFPISGDHHFIQRIWHDENGRIVQWAVIQMLGRPRDGRQIAVYDNCHGKGAHVHFINREGNKFGEKALPGATIDDDIEVGLNYAVERVTKAYDENVRRSNRGY